MYQSSDQSMLKEEEKRLGIRREKYNSRQAA